MSKAVQEMFAEISAKYDIANDVLSFGVHKLWKSKLVNLAKVQSDSKILDICTGTGDLAILFAREVKHKKGSKAEQDQIYAIDFVSEMIEIAKAKSKNFKEINFSTQDAQNLNFNDNSFDICSNAFGIRNLDSPLIGLKEMYRILNTNGKVLILEFGQPKLPVFSFLYKAYSKHIMPIIGSLITKKREAYEYLPETAAKFPCREDFLTIMHEAGFKNLKFYSLFLGIAYIYQGEK